MDLKIKNKTGNEWLQLKTKRKIQLKIAHNRSISMNARNWSTNACSRNILSQNQPSKNVQHAWITKLIHERRYFT